MELRPHHGMCFQFYEGKGYSEDFTDHMGRVIAQLEKDPSQEVKLTVATDVVCANCPNNEGGSCNSLDKVKRYDEEVLKACNLVEGEEISFAKFTQLVRSETIDKGLRSSICEDCSWDYICRPKEKESKRTVLVDSQLVRSEIIDKGLRSSICGDCSWDYICRPKENETK